MKTSVDQIVAGKVAPDGPGVAVLVTKGGRPVLKQTYGMADVDAGRPITSGTRFDLASVSKPLTGLIILRLVERELLELDDTVSALVAGFRVPVRGRAITVRDLLQHTSGLRDYTQDFPGNDEVFAKINTDSHLEWLNRTRPKRAAGVRFEYNNSNYALLALIAERVTGRPFAQVARRELFRRAKMRRTFVYDGKKALPRNVAAGYAVRRGQVRPSILLTDITGDGNIYTSINDLSLLLSALQRGRIVRDGSLAQAWTNGRLAGGRPIRDGGFGYGLGWEIKGPLRSHSGGWYGTSTYLVIDTSKDVAVAVLSNDENFDAVRVGDAILRAVGE